MPDQNDFMIVVGASAGGVKAVGQVLSSLSPGINAAIGVVIHLSSSGGHQWLLSRLQALTELPCQIAAEDTPVEKGHVYIAPSDSHMIIGKDRITLGRGPMEGRWRPSIDVSLRSAAVAWNSHCIGVILTGLLDDGVSGMNAVKNCGGLCIVQDPSEAEFPDMPLAVLKNVGPDHCVRLEEIAPILEEQTSRVLAQVSVPEVFRREAALAEQTAISLDKVQEIGRHTTYSCPDCGGGLWEIKNGDLCHFRCHIGHSYTEMELLQDQVRNIENTLWVALRMMEERRHLLTNLADKEKERGRAVLSGGHYERAEEMRRHIMRLKELLFSQQLIPPDAGAEELL
jgi:two-component system, chemotaxis family, protein-glutamate methylesterase/glutaminase